MIRSPSVVAAVVGAALTLVAALACAPEQQVEVVYGAPEPTPAPAEGEGEGEGEPGGEGEGERAAVGEGEGEGEGEGGPAVVDVGHRRELRGAWVATVFGINWPTNPAASAETKQQELEDLITTLASTGVNAVFLQVRPESDALYRSDLEPWSRFLTGTQGRDPGFDPLQVAIDVAHRENVELHAWLNPYRGLSSSSTNAAANHVSRTIPEAAIEHDGMVWMDPASQTVRAHVVAVVEDIVERYDVDGVHFDDYFYPYPGSGEVFPDGAAYDAYVDDGGSFSKGDWRRDNVNALISDVSTAIREARPSVRFGVSPFGIYKNGVPAGIRGLDAYDAISCDPVAWIDNDWVDYLAPQLYWPTTQTAQAFGTLLPWWASLTDGDGRFVVAGMNLTELGSDEYWTIDEYRDEIAIVRDHDDEGARGAILYHADPLLSDQDGVGAVFGSELWATPSLPPPVVIDPRIPATPTVTRAGASLTVTLGGLGADDRGWAVYAASEDANDDASNDASNDGGGFVIQRLVPATEPVLTLAAGRFAITAVGHNDRESRGLVIDLR